MRDSLLVTRLTFPEQRNYNVNFATDEVLTQVDNSYDGRFYQLLTANLSMNPGLSGLTRMAMSDLFEDYRIIGGFRLALDLNNNDYMLRLQNIRRRLDKDLILQRRSIQGIVENVGLAKQHTHMATYRMTWPFSELASLRGSIMYRHDRIVIQSTDNLSLRVPNAYDQTVGAKLEYVYDSSIPRGLNLAWRAPPRSVRAACSSPSAALITGSSPRWTTARRSTCRRTISTSRSRSPCAASGTTRATATASRWPTPRCACPSSAT